MSKKILAVFFLLIILAIGGQSAFWFFKTSQLERHLSKYSKDSDGIFTIDRFEISGFPLQQNVSVSNLTIKVPDSIAKDNKIIFQKINLSSSIFGNIFNAQFIGNAILKTANAVNNIEFDQAPTATLNVSSDGISKLVYSDKGYRIFGPDKNMITRSGPNNAEFSSKKNESGQIISRIRASSTNTESFDLAAFYKNHYEEKIIDGIKTGKIQIGLKELEQEQNEVSEQEGIDEMEKIAQNNQGISPQALNAQFEKDMMKKAQQEVLQQEAEQEVQATSEEVKKIEAKEAEVKEIKEELANKAEEIPNELQDIDEKELVTAQNSQEEQKGQEEMSEEIVEKTSQDKEARNEELAALENDIAEEVMKNNIEIDIEYVLTPVTQNSGQINDPTKIAQIVTKYNKSYKINKFVLSNDKFQVKINGQLDRDREDIKIFGFMTLKIDKVDNFVNYVQSSFIDIANKNDSKIKTFDPSYNSAIVKDGYSSFLSVVSEKLLDVMGEIAEKNQLSEENVMVFDIRREKNLDIIVNETPMREIVGKF